MEVQDLVRRTKPQSELIGDMRFRALMSAEAWASLPAPIRRRFSKCLADGRTAVFTGYIEATRLSRLGRALGLFTRLIGGPLPTSRDTDVPSIVTITEDFATGGQIWTRIYTRRRGFPQVIHSSKRFVGRSGLEEHVGGGVGMALSVHAEAQALVFRSAGYFCTLCGVRLHLPGWATPGALTVSHAELGNGRFRFTLDITHPRFGSLIHQTAVFQEDML